MRSYRIWSFTGVGIALMATASAANAAISYSTPGSLYSENFNSLPNTPSSANMQVATAYPVGWVDDSSTTAAGTPTSSIGVPGWYLDHRTNPSGTEDGSNTHQRFRAGTGASGTGSFYGFGGAGLTDRALGSVPSTTISTDGDSLRIGLRLTNTTGATLTTFTITYNGEQWRDDASTGQLSFSYVLNPATNATNWHTAPSAVFVSAAAFNAPVTGGIDAAVNGNSTGRVNDISATVTGISWAAGTDLWLRWSQIQVADANDDGLAIDDVRFTAAVPEPGSLALVGLAGLGLIRRRYGSK